MLLILLSTLYQLWLVKGQLYSLQIMTIFHTTLFNEGRRGVKIALQGITKEWNDLAEALGLSESDIDTIKTNNPGDVRQCVKEVVDQWFKRKGSESPSWTNLCKALRDVLVHRNDVALEIEKHH